MPQKRPIIGTLSFLLIALLLIGGFALASELGSGDDPVVSLKYLQEIENQIKGQIDTLVKEGVQQHSQDLENQYAAAMKSLEDMVSGGQTSTDLVSNELFINAVADAVISKMEPDAAETSNGIPSLFKRVDIPAGKTVTLSIGSMFFVRLGSATCYSSGSPGLINLTTGKDISNGSSLETNNLYTVTVENGRGFKSGSGTTTIFLIGSYTTN